MILINKLLLTILILAVVNVAKSAEAKNQEFLLLKVPGLSEIGSVTAGWFIVRNGNFWNGAKKIDLNQMVWPFWDKNQIPALLVPAQNQISILEIFDVDQKQIHRQPLSQPFSFFDFEKKKKLVPKFFRILNQVLDGRIEAQSKMMEIPSPRSFLRCQISSSAGSIPSDTKIKSCLNSLKGYFADDQVLSQQMYIKFVWPKAKDREERIWIKQKIRDFKVLSKSKGMVFTSDDGGGDQFNAEIGITNSERLPEVQFADLHQLNVEKVMISPKAYESKKLAHEFLQEESKLSFYILPSDLVSQGSFTETVSEDVISNVQIIKNSEGTEPVFSTTATFENRTGLGSLFRNWKATAFTNANFLASNKGEREKIYGLPGFEFEHYLADYSAYPFLRIENQLMHLNSSLAITEIALGAFLKSSKWPSLKYKFGYLQYSLSGTNDGATRLGVFRSPYIGAQFEQAADQWNFFENIDIFAVKSFSYAVKAGIAWNSKLKNLEYLQQYGVSIGYSDYRAAIVNKLNNTETLSETRFQITLFAGVLGPDYARSLLK